MLEKAKQLWNELDQQITVNKREMTLCLVCAALAGAVLGILLSPQVNVTIGSHNAITPGAADEEASKETKETEE